MATHNHEDPNVDDKVDSNEDENEERSCMFASVRGHLSSKPSRENSRRSISSSVLTVEGSRSKKGDVCHEMADETNHLPWIGTESRTEVNLSNDNIAEQCLKCKTTVSTHFCRSCSEERQYMCYVCLKDHNYWFDDHDVVTLSVESEGNLRLQADKLRTPKTSEMPQLPSKVHKDDDQKKGTHMFKDMSAISTGGSDSRKTFNQGNQLVSKGFYKDNYYLGIAQELRTQQQRCKSEGKLQKYGMYLTKIPSDSKACAITGIVQLENKKLLLADSENCELKIMNEETLNIIVSHRLPSNPYLMRFVKENKVIIACINNEFHSIDLKSDIDIDIKKMFEIKRLFKCIAWVSNELWGCTSDTIEVYSDTGQDISKFKPENVANIKDMCVSTEGDIIYCADEKKGIVVLDKHGTVVDIISENLCQPQRLCLGNQGYIFVTETNSDRVMQVDIHRKNAKQIGREDLFMENSPISLCHEKTNNRLIVAVWQNDKIHVYTCPSCI